MEIGPFQTSATPLAAGLDDLGSICQLQRISRADADAQLAAGAVPWRHLGHGGIVASWHRSPQKGPGGAGASIGCTKVIMEYGHPMPLNLPFGDGVYKGWFITGFATFEIL